MRINFTQTSSHINMLAQNFVDCNLLVGRVESKARITYQVISFLEDAEKMWIIF